jgi:hypothetical protein
MVQIKIGTYRKTRMVDRPLNECIISKLEPVFDKNGKPIYYSKQYKEVTNDLVKQIYDECSTI